MRNKQKNLNKEIREIKSFYFSLFAFHFVPTPLLTDMKT